MKKIIICIICVLILAIIVMREIDMSRIKNNKPVVFSTWGWFYATIKEDTNTDKTGLEQVQDK